MLGFALEPTGEENSGERIGPYKLLQKIGEGGFGVVWMAEQSEPIRRLVAVKILKLGMDSEEIIARFEAERQALALMEHPNIARVFDAGATATGRPYFVMELVRGVPITRYCDEHRLPAAPRLQLFVAICQAVQHAHQKGIIHRDLKPSNILVTLHDGAPVPVVIDFGIAKATHARLTDKTLFTRFHAFMGTPAYTSPEQMEMSGLDVDTRSDIYSLGVLLYELLTGRPPFDGDALARAGLDAMRRLIREVDPPRPSTRLTTLPQADRASVALQRGTEPGKLALLLRGDLDWIVMRCLEKDRTRRYDTAAGLAADVERHLASEPVNARPPTAGYRLGKFIRRHRVAFAAGSVMLASLVAGLVMLAVMLVRERAAVQRETALRAAADASAREAQVAAAKSAEVARFMTDMLAGVAPSAARGRDTTMLREILDNTAQKLDKELAGQPDVATDLRDTLGVVYRDIGQYVTAEKLLREALEVRRKLNGNESDELANTLETYAKTLTRLGRPGAKALLVEALAIRQKLHGEKHPLTVRSLAQLSHLPAADFGSFQEWEALRHRVLALRIEVLGPEHPDVAESYFGLGTVARARNDLAESARWYRRAIDLRRKALGPDHPELVADWMNLGATLALIGQTPDAMDAYREGLQLAIRTMPEHPRTTVALLQLVALQPLAPANNAVVELARATITALREHLNPGSPLMAVAKLGLAVALANQPDGGEEARSVTREATEALAANRRTGVAPPPEVLAEMGNCAVSRIFGGAPAQAFALAEQQVLFARAGLGPPLARTPSCLVQLAMVHFYAGRTAEAATLWAEAIPLYQKTTPGAAPALGNLSMLGAAYRETGRAPEAERVLRDGLTLVQQRLEPGRAPDPAVATIHAELGLTLNAQSRFADAERHLRQALEYHDRADREKPDQPRTRLWQQLRPRAEAESGLGEALAGQGRFAEAEPLLVQAFADLQAHRKVLAGDQSKLPREAAARLAAFYAAWGKPDKAAEWRAVQP